MKRRFRILKRVLIALGLLLALGLLIPENIVVPVENASPDDWNENSFWYEPWGASGVHKGIDIFARMGATVRSATAGIVVYRGHIRLGGNILVVLGPKWRFHYYAHLDTTSVGGGDYVSNGEAIGSVGTSGNAAGKEPHLHYVIFSMLPYPWNLETGTQGWKRMFYLDPNQKLRNSSGS